MLVQGRQRWFLIFVVIRGDMDVNETNCERRSRSRV